MASGRTAASLLLAALVILPGAYPRAHAHAVAGMRVFPATLSFDDPGVANEWPIVAGHSDGTNSLATSLSRKLTPHLGLTLGTSASAGPGDPFALDDWTVGLAYQWLIHPTRETMLMTSFSDHLGGTGGASAAPYSTYIPEIAVGQGFGDLTNPLSYWRPLALTGTVSLDVPARAGVPRTLNWDYSIQYSIPYLENFVRDVGIRGFARQLVPIIEVPMQSCLDAGCPSRTEGSLNPGVIWVGHDYQWGIEGVIPVHAPGGSGLGILLGFDLYLDDLGGSRFARPLFGDANPT